MVEEKDVKMKSGKGFVIAIIILVMIVLGLVGYICYDKQIIFKDSNKVEEKDNKKESVEKEITDSVLKEDISDKINFITFEFGLTDAVRKSSNAYGFKNGESPFGNVFENYTDDLKLKTVLNSLYYNNEFDKISSENINNEFASQFIKDYGVDAVEQVSAEKVKEQYKLYFGTDVVELKSVNHGCFGYTYDKKSNLFLKLNPTCGGTSAGYVYTYKNKFITKDDYLYVYVNYGESAPDADNDTYLSIYKDFNLKEKYKENISTEESMNFKIDETNYKEFSEYKYTFKKDSNDNYYFVSLAENK